MSIKRVMIVEDSPEISSYLRIKLVKFGYTVIGCFNNGKDAIDNYHNLQPDLILMDIYIQGNLTGIETAAEILKKSFIPIIYLTTSTANDVFEKAKETMPFGYILKPFKDKELQNAIEIALYKAGVEKELQASQARYAALYDFSPTGYFTLDNNAKILEINLTGATQLGQKRPTLLNNNFFDFIETEYIDIFKENLEKVFSYNTRITSEIIIKQKGNYKFYAQIDSIPIVSASGKVVQVLNSITNIDNRKILEKSLEESKDFFQGIFENVQIGMAVLNTKMEFIKYNKKFLMTLGENKNSLNAQNITLFFNFSDMEDFNRNKNQLLDKEINTFEYFASIKENISVKLDFSVVYGYKGEILYIILLCQEI